MSFHSSLKSLQTKQQEMNAQEEHKAQPRSLHHQLNQVATADEYQHWQVLPPSPSHPSQIRLQQIFFTQPPTVSLLALGNNINNNDNNQNIQLAPIALKFPPTVAETQAPVSLLKSLSPSFHNHLHLKQNKLLPGLCSALDELASYSVSNK